MIVYRQVDTRFAFLWEDDTQPSARWHRQGEGPAQYFADTPGGAWAEFLRHEEITDVDDLDGIRRALWAVEIGDPVLEAPVLPDRVVRGGLGTYRACQDEAARLRVNRATGLQAKSAALAQGAASGWRVDVGLQPAPPADGQVIVLFGPRPDLLGWLIVDAGRPPIEVLLHVRPL